MSRRKEEARDWVERLERIKAAKERGDRTYLLAALIDPDHRGRAARFLAELGAEEAVAPIVRLLDASDASTRIDASKALGELRALEAAPRLREVAKQDREGIVRGWAASALAKMEDPEAFDVTLPLLRHPSGWIRVSAAVTLGEIGDLRALGPLRDARPRFLRTPVEWDAFHRGYQDAIAVLERRAAGKEPRRIDARSMRRLRLVAWLIVLIAGPVLLWVFVGHWWALAVVAATGITLVLSMTHTLRTFPFDALERNRDAEI